MKIESKHGIKLPAYALGASFIAATTLLTGCPLIYAGGMETCATTDPGYEGDIQVIDDPTTVTTEPTDPVLGVFGAATGTYADFNLSKLGNQYSMFMNKIDEIEATAPGEFKYNITAVRDRDYERYFFILSTYQGMTRKHYVIYNGVWTEMADPPYYDTVKSLNALDYESVKSLPFLVDTANLKHMEVSENGIKKDQATPIVSSVSDGDYLGEIIGFSQDGTKALLKIGKPVIFPTDELRALKPGDRVGFLDFEVVNEKVPVDEQYYVAKVKSETYPDLGECHFDRYTNAWDGDTNKSYLMQDWEYWVEDTVIVELPLSSDCKVFNTAEFFDHSGDFPEEWAQNGFPITETYLFGLLAENEFKLPNDNGWYATIADTQSVIIENGEVTRIEMYHPLVIY